MQADPETMASFAPVLNLPATVVSLAIIGGAYVMRSRTEQAIAVRDKRLAAEKTLQQLKVKAVSGEAESGAVDAMQAEISGLQEEEDSLLAVFGNKEIRLRIPPPPQVLLRASSATGEGRAFYMHLFRRAGSRELGWG